MGGFAALCAQSLQPHYSLSHMAFERTPVFVPAPRDAPSVRSGDAQGARLYASAHPEVTVYPGPQSPRKAVTLRTLRAKYEKGQPITMVTAYDYPSAVHVSSSSSGSTSAAAWAAAERAKPRLTRQQRQACSNASSVCMLDTCAAASAGRVAGTGGPSMHTAQQEQQWSTAPTLQTRIVLCCSCRTASYRLTLQTSTSS